jgi:hypothetical protein
LTSDPGSFVAAEVHRGLASGHHRPLPSPTIFKTCANIPHCKNYNKVSMLNVLRRIKWTCVHAILSGISTNAMQRIAMLII